MTGAPSESRENGPFSGRHTPGETPQGPGPGERPVASRPSASQPPEPPAPPAPAEAAVPPAPPAERRTRVERRQGERRRVNLPVAVDRRAGEDRRQTPERRRGLNRYELDAAEMEFIQAIQRFKDRTGRPFPTWSEVLGILRSLGYEKRT